MTRRTLAALALMLAAACGPAPRVATDPLVIALTTSPVNLDPGVAADESSQKMGQLIFSSLMKIGPDLRVIPDLATRFDAIDPQTYLVEIPSGVQFHDGRELTSEDVAYTFRRFLNPAFKGRSGAYAALASVEIKDRSTVLFHLKMPAASFPINLVMGIVPVGTGPEAARKPIGSGPYRVTEFVPDDHIALAPFAGYYRGAPKNSGLVFRTVPDETMRGLELRKGSVDVVINDLSPDLIHNLQEGGHIAVVTGPGTDYAYLGMNVRDPLLRDRRVRQAIGHAVDRAAIAKYLRRDLARPATGIVPPMSWAAETDITAFSFDIAAAKALLDESGHADPDGDGPGLRFRLSLKVSTAEPYRLQAAVIQQQLAQVGIGVDVRSQEFATLSDDVKKGNMQLFTLVFVGITDPDIMRLVFHSSQMPPVGLNRGRYSSPEVDRLIERASASLDETERGSLYRQLQRVLADEAPAIPLWFKVNVAIAQSNVTGITLSPTADFLFFKDVFRMTAQ